MVHLDAVVQWRTGWVERQVLKGLDERSLPALSRTPLYGQHVVGEAGSKGRHLCLGLSSGAG